MKKISTLLFALCVMTFLVNAQVNAVITDFEDGTLQGWTTFDADGDGYGWVLGSASSGIYHYAELSVVGQGHNNSQDMMCSGSYSNAIHSSLNPDNYLITPKISLSAGAILTFWVTAQDSDYHAEHYAVLVSATGTNVTDFTTVFEETFSNTKTQSPWQQKTVNLSGFAGLNVYIAFRHFNCTDMFILNLDDIIITNATLASTGITENNSNVSIYPIPANSVVNVNTDSDISSIEIYSISGQKVGDFTADDSHISINTGDLSNGMYLMKISTENGVINKKFSVAHK